MERIYAWDHRHEQVVYRIPGHTYKDGREDSDLSPVWLPASPDELPEGVAIDDLRKVDVKEEREVRAPQALRFDKSSLS